ncbi:hypothetical protein BVY03_05820 [bacterium K02(2017)]|nr:hypothetical protein BVY03_05820 [bacterium K02(2017)]
MKANVFLRTYPTSKKKMRYYLVIRRRGCKDTTISLGQITKKQAEQQRVIVLSELLTGIYSPQTKLAPYIEEFRGPFLEWAKGNRSQGTYLLYVNNLKFVIRDFCNQRLHNITREQIENHLSRLSVSNRTKNIRLNTIRRLFTKAVDWGYLNKSPTDGIKQLKENSKGSRSLTPNELSHLLGIASPWQLSFIRVAIYTGLRRAELLNFKFKDIEWENERIEVIGKGSKKRYVYINADLKHELEFLSKHWPNPLYGNAWSKNVERYCLRTKEQMTYVFCLKDGQPIKKDLNSLRILFKKAKLDGVTLHGLRKTYCSLLARGNVHPKVAQLLMGHSDVRLTMDIYTEAQPDQLLDAVKQLPTLRNLQKSNLKLVNS